MKSWQRVWMCSLVTVLIFVSYPARLLAQTNSDGATQKPAAERDGQHDFDFEIGSWKIHLKRLQHPLTGSTSWVEFDGTSVTRKIWDGRARLSSSKLTAPLAGTSKV